MDYLPDDRDPAQAVPAVWFLPAGTTPDPAATSVQVLVDEQGCTGGRGAAGNTARPVIEVTATEIRIAISTFIRKGPQSCPAHPLSPVVVELGRPRGDRVLIDAHGSVDDGNHDPRERYGDITAPAAASR